jgi:processive 1,2-diacylglycerol beta-glucosyltransferase
MGKIIVTYASVGGGHLRAAEAIYRYLKDNQPQDEVTLVDTLDYCAPIFRYAYTRGYEFLVYRAPLLWQGLFYLTYLGVIRFLTRLLDQFYSRRFSALLLRENPEAVICTHFLPAELCAHLKRKRRLSAHLVTLITDFGVHPYWLAKGTDIYAVACPHTREKLVRRGVPPESIRLTGIPVDEKFTAPYSRDALAKKLGLEADKFTALAITGSFGVGPLEKIAEALQEDIQVLVVCARNHKLLKKMQKRNLASVRAFGFIDNPQELMSVSDIIITKPGGLTLSEILAMGLVPVFIQCIPGQETQNAAILKKYGIGSRPKSLSELKNIVLDYRQHPQKLAQVRARMELLKITDSAAKVAHALR